METFKIITLHFLLWKNEQKVCITTVQRQVFILSKFYPMKILSIILILSCLLSYTTAQTSFIIENIVGPDNESISDIKYANSRYYALSTNTEAKTPFRKTSTLFVFNNTGELTHQAQLGDFGYTYFRILSVNNNKVKLVGKIKTDTCSSMLTMSEYFISTGSLTHLSQYQLCNDEYIHSVRIVPGLDDKIFFEVLYSNDEFNQSIYTDQSYILTLDSLHNFSLVLDLGYWVRHLSVDFSGNGYIITDSYVYEYYDRDFNHKYQYNNGGTGFSREKNSFHHPLVNNYMLEQVVYEDNDHKKSERIMLVDSNLRVKKLAIIDPLLGFGGSINLPIYGGVSIGSYNSVWSVANFGYAFHPDQSYISITRLDSDMKIVCHQFIGFDALYQIYGITAFEDNGAIIYGGKKPYGEPSGDEDIYALKIGNECELSTTATNGPEHQLHSISAYPNPGINNITFSVNGFTLSTLRMELIDEMGRVIFSAHDLSDNISVPDLPVGQYFYRVLQEEKLLGTGSWVKE